jgi:hypothetical protein
MVRQIFKDIKDEGTGLFKDLKRGVGDAFKNVREDVTDGFGAAKDFVKRFKVVEDKTPDIFYPELYQDECNTVLLVNPGIYGSNFRFIYRHPNCTVKPVTPPSPKLENNVTPLKKPENPCDGVPLYIVCPTRRYLYGHGGIYGRNSQTGDYYTSYGDSWRLFERYITLLSVRYPVYFEGYGWGATITYHQKYASIGGNRYGTVDQSDVYEGITSANIYPGCIGRELGVWYGYDDGYKINVAADQGGPEFIVGIGVFPIPDSHLNSVDDAYAYRNRSSFLSLIAQQPAYTDGRDNLPTINVSSPGGGFSLTKSGRACIDTFYGRVCWYDVPVMSVTNIEYSTLVFCGDYDRDSPPPTPPPPMSCCPNVQQNDQLLRLILKRIGEPKEVIIFDEDLARKGAQKAKKKPQSLNDYLKLAVERTEIVSRIVGIENFPITVPDTMIEPHKEGAFAKIFGFIDGKKKRKINTIAEFIAWMSEQDSAVLGQFHQVIEFETGGKDKKGKAEKATVVLPNVAETLKEIIILTSQMALQNNVQTELIFKIASEVVAARAAAHKSALIAADIQDYLDYPTETKSGETATNVNFPRVNQNQKGQFEVTSANEDYKEFLKAGKVKFSYDDWTGDTSLRDQLMDLLQVASALRASMMQRIDK